ncbi:MAG: hypothetical protein RJB66_928 [Pseudomonadota bacterium]|jgi:phosphohistidine phosphatase SixA
MTLKEFVIFRHAQKGSWSNDPELSQEGHAQAKQLVNLVHQQIIPPPDILFCSPKKRSEQTFIPLRDEFRIPLEVDPNLDERGASERGLAFEGRIKNFLDVQLPQRPHTCVYLCTHLDWMEIFGSIAPIDVDITNDVIHMPPAYFYHFSLVADPSGLWKLMKKSRGF